MCKNCGRQFIGNHALTYKGCDSAINQKILKMLVRGVGIRDIVDIEQVSAKKVLSVLVNSNRIITPRQTHYDKLEVDKQLLSPPKYGLTLATKRIKFG